MGKNFHWRSIFSPALVFAGPCDPGSKIFAPFPGIGAIVQAEVISEIIDGAFIVQWEGSPDLCTDPSTRGKCIIDATTAYNIQVFDPFFMMKFGFRGFPVRFHRRPPRRIARRHSYTT
jgi:hypothetical protein